MLKDVALGFIGGSCLMVHQHIFFQQFDSSPTACFRNIVQDDAVLITMTSAAYRLCYSSQRVQHWQQLTQNVAAGDLQRVRQRTAMNSSLGVVLYFRNNTLFDDTQVTVISFAFNF